jgi:histone-lysine N-methyltransferase SETMAR
VRRVELALSVLQTLEVQEQRAWHEAVTLDESWLDCIPDYESIMLPPGEKVPERPRITIQCNTSMVTIVWNPSGFHFIRVVPNGCEFNSNYYRRELLEPLAEWRCEQAGGAVRKLIVHADNARPHTAAASQEFIEENGLERAIHPPYSPDLAPSDFSLFSHVKYFLRGQSFETADELFLAIRAVSRHLEKWTLHAAFLDWMQRLRQCTETNGDYLEEA